MNGLFGAEANTMRICGTALKITTVKYHCTVQLVELGGGQNTGLSQQTFHILC